MIIEQDIRTLIAMSNAGKSEVSQWMEKVGYERICCDDRIEAILDPELKEQGFKGGIHDMAGWMGQPYDERYPRTSRRYLELEGKILTEAMAEIRRSKAPRVVIDTTGSAIYSDPAILQALSAMSTIIYLETSELRKKEMYEMYLAHPKPVIWGDSFSPEPGEDNMQALARCYPLLLDYRAGRYEQLAHVKFRADDLRNPHYSVDKFLQRSARLHV